MKPRASCPFPLLVALALAVCAVVLPQATAWSQPAVRKAEVELIDGDEFARLARIEDELRAARALLNKADRVLDDYTRARDHLDRALEIDPGRARTWFEVAEIYHFGIDASQAWSYYEEFLELATERDTDWARAHALLAARGLDEIELLEVPPEHLLDDTERHLLAAYEVYRTQQQSNVMADLEDYLRQIAIHRGDYETALRYARAAIDHGHGERFFIALSVSGLLSMLGRDEEALAYLEALPAELRGHAFDPLIGSFYLNLRLAETHRRLGNHDTALQYLEFLDKELTRSAEQNDPFNTTTSGRQGRNAFFDKLRAELHGARASVYIDMGDIEAAEAAFRSAWGLDPGDPGSMNNLAWVLAVGASLHDPRLEEAEQLAREAVALEPTAAYLDTLAEVLIRRERYDEALELIDQALEQAPDSVYLDSQRRRVERMQAGAPVTGGTIDQTRPWRPPRGAAL